VGFFEIGVNRVVRLFQLNYYPEDNDLWYLRQNAPFSKLGDHVAAAAGTTTPRTLVNLHIWQSYSSLPWVNETSHPWPGHGQLILTSILDAYGHLSFRHPTKPDVFIMPRNMAPANISSSQDLVEYQVSDASATDPNAPVGYIERYVHSEVYKKYPTVNSVIHSHDKAVVPYGISGVTTVSWSLVIMTLIFCRGSFEALSSHGGISRYVEHYLREIF
jgi:Class II Aldolase and Adducin N-terminal domain